MNQSSFIKGLAFAAMLVSLISVSSCKKFLETKQFDRSNEEQFYKSASDFEQAVIGAYSSFDNLYNSGNFYFLLTDMRSDNTSVYVPGGSAGPLSKSEYDDFTLTSNNEHLISFWNVSYSLIQKSNDIITFVAGAAINDSLKNQYVGEAKVLRALAYFNLVRLYGGVPLVLERFKNIDDSYKKGRNTAEEIYTQIESDLKEAETLLVIKRNTGDNSGRADLGIASSLLGSVYLTEKKYPEAAAEFKKVIDMNEYSLLSNYSDLFASGQQGNNETIWQAYYLTGAAGVGSSFPNYCAPLNSEGVLIPTGLAFAWNQPTSDIENAYDANDLRKASIGDGFTKDGIVYPYKYIKNYVDNPSGTGDGNSGKDWYILRYADILLMYAEAINETDGPANAYGSLNLVRERAGLEPLTTGLSMEAFRDAVYREERLESPFEGHRWFDLVRTGRAVEVMNSKVKPQSDANCVGISSPIDAHQLLLPIPSIVIEMASQITQNPGY